jgi:adenosylcobinamide kinase/adenosylcobinamide-phosphate guanylyltransferase
VVSSDVFSGGRYYEEESLRYLRNLAELNRRLAGGAELVVEAVCGIPNVLKGKLP